MKPETNNDLPLPGSMIEYEQDPGSGEWFLAMVINHLNGSTYLQEMDNKGCHDLDIIKTDIFTWREVKTDTEKALEDIERLLDMAWKSAREPTVKAILNGIKDKRIHCVKWTGD